MNYTDALLFLAINRISFLRPREKILLAEIISTLPQFLHSKQKEIEHIIGRTLREALWRPEEYLSLAESDKKYLTKANIRYTFYCEDGYPKKLKEIYDPPLVLYYRGKGLKENYPFVAVVGTRKPTGDALMKAYALGVELSAAQLGVVSGLAKGIDTAVHKGCVSVGGYAVAVMGNGIDMVYPVSSKSTALKILEDGGTLLSEYPPGIPPLKYHFPERNRIISGLADVVIIVQAPKKSGALITADFALEQGKELCVHKVGLAGIYGEGTHLLFEQGAEVIDSAYSVIKNLRGVKSNYVSGTSKKKFNSYEDGSQPGKGLAALLEMEIDDKISVYNGEYYWSE
jgi:DNA processing protein